MTWQNLSLGVVLAAMTLSSQALAATRPVIYQLMVRTFGNTNETRKTNGTLAENGCGKFNDINDAALTSLKTMGFTHVWLTGVLEQASGTAYPNRPADAPDILKGIAGSPYAIKDYFDVCPDYAVDPDKRLEEFKSLLDRCKSHGLKTIIDFVPNHVARSYQSDVKPELTFGTGDNHDVFFDRDNHFYYLAQHDAGGGPPLKLPTASMPGCNGLFAPETTFGRVTGNNVISWSPSINDWYETVKLNYGHDFTKGRDTSTLPGPDAALTAVPKTWRTMDAILAYWQKMGVNGFRCDMAHMVPMEFWRWAVRQARARQSDVFFSAEAYDNDPAKLTDGHVLDELIKAGFDAVYDDPSYDVLEGIYDGGKWTNDLDPLTFTGSRFHHSLRYAENHDEVRIASPKVWGGVGMKVGKPVSAVLFAMGRGAVMLYSGQEVGEPAAGTEGFGGDDARTTIFDYWSMPEFTKWVNGGKYDGGRLSDDQKSLRDWYGKLIRATQSPAFVSGEFYGLNHANAENPKFGRVGDETASGHWLYAFLRHDSVSGQSFLIVSNFSPTETLRGAHVSLLQNSWEFMGRSDQSAWKFTDRLDSTWSTTVAREALSVSGVPLPDMPPCSAMVIEITK
ncbi:MAG: alpha-amylase family glycosyl hydrolase [Luteolibacter sp.]|uniref:alpha-amylase family glycosyl hydrolase n=1 Tax=Luteolibacter sp. TaxID=1962973 RepID=UPI0032652579